MITDWTDLLCQRGLDSEVQIPAAVITCCGHGIFFLSFETGSHYVALDGLELKEIHLPLSP